MGNARWSSKDWDAYASTHTRGKSASEIFNSRSLRADMDPRQIKVRESRDSTSNPHSTPIILALDVTGSMGIIPEALIKDGLGTLVQSILDRKPVTDPHIMVMGVGDVECDNAPLQVSQFEADIRIAEQLKNIYVEGGGGGNRSESYTLPWYFAAQKTDIDCAKHGRKGVIFTFGDEECPDSIRAEQIRHFLGDKIQHDLSAAELLKMAAQKYDVFHVVIEEGDYARRDVKRVHDSWQRVLPKEQIIAVKDYRKLPEIIVSVLEVYGGKKPEDVIASWPHNTAPAVAEAIKHVEQGKGKAPGIKVMRPLVPKKLKDGPAAA